MTIQYKGTIGRTIPESKPWWPDYPRPREGAPNVLVVLFDDLGFSHLGCYGSSIETPNIDRLAKEGMVIDGAYHLGSFSGAVCTPSRHMIMSGRSLWHLPIAPWRKAPTW